MERAENYLNVVHLIGTVEEDPDCSATSWRNRQEVKFRVRTEFGRRSRLVESHTIVCRHKPLKKTASQLRRGDQVVIQGRLQYLYRRWKDNYQETLPRVVASQIAKFRGESHKGQ